MGSIEVGKIADLITLDYRQPHLYPFQCAVTRIVNHAQGQDVDNVIVAGEFAVRDRHLVQVDENKVLDDAQAAQDLMLWRFNDISVLSNPKLYSL